MIFEETSTRRGKIRGDHGKPGDARAKRSVPRRSGRQRPVARARSDVEKQVADLLVTAKDALGLSLTFLTRMDGTTQHLEVVESTIPFLFKDGSTQPQASTCCQAIRDNTLPPVIPDVRALPEAMKLPAARFPRIRRRWGGRRGH